MAHNGAPTTPQLNASNPIAIPNGGGGGATGGMIQLLPATTPLASPPPSGHSRSQSQFVPMHSPSGSLLNGNNMDFAALSMIAQSGATPASRLHGSSAAGILATTPMAASQTTLSSPTNHDYAYPVTADGYDVYAEIGSGAFSTVYRGVVRDTGENVAIKVIDLDQFNTNWDEIRKEIMIMSQLNHPNVVKLKTAFVDGQDLWIVLSLLTAGSCASVMKQLTFGNSPQGNGLKDEIMIATILKEVLQALAYFHKHGSIHRDVKAGNILISGSGDIQLADFGVAGTLMEGGDRKKNRQTFTGTPCWMAPEVMEHEASEGYDEKADIWSVGITAMELGYGRAPYAKFPPMKVMLLTLQEEPPTADIYKDYSYEFSKHFHNMIGKCLRRDPKKRPTARKLLEHKFFQRAADSKYIYEHIVRRLPVREETNEKISIRARNESTQKENATAAKAKPTASAAAVAPVASAMDSLSAPNAGGGVKLGSWVFDEEDIAAFKSTEGATSLDLLTGTLQHQHALPHHHPHGSTTVPEEEEDDDDVDIHVQQPNEPTDFFAGIIAPAQDKVHADSQPQSTIQLQPPQKQIAPSPKQQPNIHSTLPFSASSIAFAASANASSGRISPSSAFAHVAAATSHNGAAGTPTGVMSAKGTSKTNTPTLSSVQSGKRQFVVEEHVMPVGSSNIPLGSLSSSLGEEELDVDIPFSLPVDHGGGMMDDDDPFAPLPSSHRHSIPSASEQFLSGSNPPSSHDSSNASSSALTPGSATLAYLAAMGTSGPAPPPSGKSSQQPSPHILNNTPLSNATTPLPRSSHLNTGSGASSPTARPFNSMKRGSSLLPVQMPRISMTLGGPAQPSPNAGARMVNAVGIGGTLGLPASAVQEEPNLNSSLFHNQQDQHSHLHLDLTSPQTSAESTVGRFQVTSTEKNL